ncbi:signal peptidase I [Sporosarcina sp. 179-K 3D1 HS]|uniref:signal peptidase I n=1 Tax=Sporosarcina sp. 179-K 3D1 HS TaxID=3232169 RepID=UPI0039A39FD8
MYERSHYDFYSWLKSIMIAFILAVLIRQYLFTPVIVSGQSMEPTFEHNNKLVISKIYKIHHFDMIVFHAPGTEDDFIKRVIGLPGDVIEMVDDTLFINGKVYEEEYIQSMKARIGEGQRLTEDFATQVPEGKLFVLGDNRRNSMDSRVLGCIDEESVVGVVKFRFSPIREMGVPK